MSRHTEPTSPEDVAALEACSQLDPTGGRNSAELLENIVSTNAPDVVLPNAGKPASPNPSSRVAEFVLDADAPDVVLPSANKPPNPLWKYRAQVRKTNKNLNTPPAMDVLANDTTHAKSIYCEYHNLKPELYHFSIVCLQAEERREVAFANKRTQLARRGASEDEIKLSLSQMRMTAGV